MPMRVVIDAIPITGASTAIVTEHLLRAWAELDTGDEIHVVIGPRPTFEISPKLHVHRIRNGRYPMVNRLWAQSVTIPKLCRQVKADVVLGLIASTTITPLPCPRAILVHDMRHELRPEQFSRKAILVKRAGYSFGYRQAAAIACISERTRQDLLQTHPDLHRTLVRVVHHGSDHTQNWPPRQEGRGYAIAFGQYANKNVQLVLECWSKLRDRGEAMRLVIFGLGARERAETEAAIEELELSDLVTALPWLPDADFHGYFTSASLVVFPSDFEGFGLPAVEAMALGIPLVITPDPALLEVTEGHAVTLGAPTAGALADAVLAARALSPQDLERARAHAARYTWARSAATMRAMLAEAIGLKEPDRPLDEVVA